MRVQKNRASPPQQTGSKQPLPLSFPGASSTCGLPPTRPDAARPSLGHSGGLGPQEGGCALLPAPAGLWMGGPGFTFQEEAQDLRSLFPVQMRPPTTEGWGKGVESPNSSLLPDGLGTTAASFLPLRGTPDNQSSLRPYKHLLEMSQAAPGSLKVNGVELWSQIQVMTDFSNSRVTDLLVPLALSLHVLPVETQGTTGIPDAPVHPTLILGSQPCQGSRTFCLRPSIHTLQGGPSELLECQSPNDDPCLSSKIQRLQCGA